MAGRPTKYRTEFARIAGVMTELGAIRDDLARAFDVNVDTIDEWIAGRSAFSGAIKSARVLADTAVERSLYKRAIGSSVKTQRAFQHRGEPVVVDVIEQHPPEVAAGIFWLKNRKPAEWRDKINLEHSGSVDFAERLAAARKRKPGGA